MSRIGDRPPPSGSAQTHTIEINFTGGSQLGVDKPSLAAATRHFLWHPEKSVELVSTPI
jgi:hypothetical protein